MSVLALKDLDTKNWRQQYNYVNQLETYLSQKYPYMKNVVERNVENFGDMWLQKFESMLSHLFSDKTKLHNAIDGYVKFSLDALKLHKQFEKDLEYIPKTYEEAAAAVYHDKEYMHNLYLPGILLSHFLWVHHYRQMLFFEQTFLLDMHLQGADKFYDVGIGSGYYSRVALEHLPNITGQGFDISESAKEYALWQVGCYSAQDRYDVNLQNILTDPPAEKTDWLMCVEVLEHLEDPTGFLKGLRKMMTQEGKAFITAALNAPNEDHIFLYRRPEEVYDQLTEAGFAVEQYIYCAGYPPAKKGVPVPEVAAFVVTCMKD